MYNFNYFFSNKVQGEDTHKDTFLEKKDIGLKLASFHGTIFKVKLPIVQLLLMVRDANIASKIVI